MPSLRGLALHPLDSEFQETNKCNSYFITISNSIKVKYCPLAERWINSVWKQASLYKWLSGSGTHISHMWLTEMSTDQDRIGLDQDWSQFWPHQDWIGLQFVWKLADQDWIGLRNYFLF